MRVLLTYNPEAGDDGVDPGQLIAELEAAGHDVSAASVKEDWARQLDGTFDLVVAAGGDGSVGKVFKELASRGPAAAIAPVGSANNIAQSLGFDLDASRPSIGQRRRRYDVCSLGWQGGGEHFVEAAGGGVFADMLARAERTPIDATGDEKILFGLRMLVDLAAEARPDAWGIEADGVDLSAEYVAAEVLNSGLVGPNVPLAPDAEPGDGLLDLVLIRAADVDALRTHAQVRLESGEAPKLHLETHRVKKVVLEPPKDRPFHVDDDLLQLLPERLTATVDAAVDVFVP